MKKAPTAAVATALSVAALAGGIGFTAGSSQAQADRKPKPAVQNEFDPLGPAMHETKNAGRTVHYSDTGEKNATPVLFMGGTGTTARASGMTEFLRTTRQKLNLRLISVERNGFGDTEYDAKLGFDDYTSDVRAVLDKLHLRKAAVVAISGGGPYAAHFAADAPGRISSLHLAAALPPYGAKADYCGKSDAELTKYFGEQIRDPREWWGFPEDSPMHDIPGFTDRAEEDGGRSYYLRGQKGDPAAQVHEQKLYCERPGPDLSKLEAPAYVYTGAKDTTVPPATQARWKKALPSEPTVRTYDDSGHDVQYRHWDQILLDMAGYADRTAVCTGRKTRVLPHEKAERAVRKGATLGSCAWR
ncbi:alpha/beta fold hydrolase [Streptomyces reniochalinae]|uniref:Alpha/beta hydrolase n=1 Tax=Streptomyces reniochalinae TaxID=2250578 RepID=A0A367ELI6_9ACTN|nr:alpha/beta hydrolase [Streptomyces reniochalinae]RCG18823.1 alpha/beta hydrolase [Streptomyces reniochalinae]